MLILKWFSEFLTLTLSCNNMDHILYELLKRI